MVAGRYVFTALACLGNMMTLLGRDSLRIAVLAMPNISPEQRSHVLGGYSYGMVVTMVAGGPLADTLGGKWLLAAVVLLSAACTAMVPLLADTTAAGLVACQVVAGLSGGLTVPALGVLIARWQPDCDRGRLATVIYTGSQLSAVFTSLLTGLVGFHWDWRWVFYSLGLLPLLWLPAWLALVTDCPAQSRLVGREERELLARQTSVSASRPRLADIPVTAIMTSGPVWAVVAANIGCSWATTHTSLLLPQFLHSVLQLPLHHNSALSSLPYIGCCLTGLLAGWIFSQLTRCLSRTAARKVRRQTGGRLLHCSVQVSSSVCLWGFAALSLPVPWLAGNTALVTIATTAAYSLMGFNLVGAWSNPLDIAPNYVSQLHFWLTQENVSTKSVN